MTPFIITDPLSLYGSKIKWNIECKSTKTVSFVLKIQFIIYIQIQIIFNFQKQLFKTTNYKLSTSNQYVSGYEDYNYKIKIEPDEYPKINVLSNRFN